MNRTVIQQEEKFGKEKMLTSTGIGSILRVIKTCNEYQNGLEYPRKMSKCIDPRVKLRLVQSKAGVKMGLEGEYAMERLTNRKVIPNTSVLYTTEVATKLLYRISSYQCESSYKIGFIRGETRVHISVTKNGESITSTYRQRICSPSQSP
jgi:hypothetical protein